MKAKVLITFKRGNQTLTQMVSVKKSECIIGRSDADLTIDDPRCSRHHCLLYEGTNGMLQVRDLSSTNGTYVNGEKVEEYVLQIGDEVRVGRSTLKIIEFEASHNLEIVTPATFERTPNPTGMQRTGKGQGMNSWFTIDPNAQDGTNPKLEEPAPQKKKKTG